MAAYTLPELPYDYAALEPHYSAKIVELHHDKHHAGYVKQANIALDELVELRASGSPDPARLRGLEKALAFNVSGHLLHTVFWPTMSPDGGGEPEGELAAAIGDAFGSVKALRAQLNEATTSLQGSGWGVLVWEPFAGSLMVQQVYDHQSNMTPGNLPLLVIDGWEHAFYLQFLTDKAGWVESFWKMVNWPMVADRFEQARSARLPDVALAGR